MALVNDTTVLVRRTGIALAAALALSFGATAPARANKLACKPNVRVTNQKGASIKVLRFLYTVGGTEYSEGLTNKRLAPDETENWPSQTLQNAATGIVITSSRIEYKNDNSGAGDGYGPPVMSSPFPHSYTCNASHNYIHVVS